MAMIRSGRDLCSGDGIIATRLGSRCAVPVLVSVAESHWAALIGGLRTSVSGVSSAGENDLTTLPAAAWAVDSTQLRRGRPLSPASHIHLGYVAPAQDDSRVESGRVMENLPALERFFLLKPTTSLVMFSAKLFS